MFSIDSAVKRPDQFVSSSIAQLDFLLFSRRRSLFRSELAEFLLIFVFVFRLLIFPFFFVLLNFVVVCTTGSGLQAGTNGRLGYYADYLFDRPGYPLLGRPNGGRLLLPPPTSQAAPLASRQSRGGGDYFARSQEPAAILCHGQPCVVIFRIHPQTQKSRWYWIPLAPHPHTFRRVSRLSTAIYLSFPSSIPIPSHFL